MEEGKNGTDLWAKYWIAGGLFVVHRNDVTDINKDRMHLFKMTVDKLVKHSKGGSGDNRRVYVDGVKCHWIDNDRKYQVGQFHTHELVPFDIAEKGIEAVNNWTNRKFT